MGALNKEQILAAEDLPRELVQVPEWGGEVWVRAMTATERDKFEADLTERRGSKVEVNMANTRAKLCAKVICDEAGNRLFSDSEIKALGDKSAAALTRVFEVARRLSALSSAEVEELAKN